MDEVKESSIVSPISLASDVPSSSSGLINYSDQLSFFRSYSNITNNELHDFSGKIRSKRLSNRFKLSLSSIDEVVYRDVGTLVLKSNQVRHLCKAVLKNELGFVSTLLERGVSPNCFDEHRRTPLHLAVSKGYCGMVDVVEICHLMIVTFENRDLPTNCGGRNRNTTIGLCVQPHLHIFIRNITLYRLLLNNGADPNIKDGLGNSCLHLAACTNNAEMTSTLIRGGASVNTVDIRGRSPVQLAQSKLRILQKSSNESVKSKVTEIIDMLILYLEKGSITHEKSYDTECLSNFHNRLQITETPEELNSEIDGLRKVLDRMETLSLSQN